MKKLILTIFTLLAALVLVVPVSAQSIDPPGQPPLILTDEQGEYPLGLHLAILEDPSGALTIQDVISPQYAALFVPSQVEVPNYGFTDSAYWVRIRVDNQTQSTENWLLEQGFANTHFVDLYYPGPDGQGYDIKQTGVLRPVSTRDLLHPRIIFSLVISPQSEQTYYLRFQNGASMTIPLTLWTQAAFMKQSLVEQTAMGIFYGVLIGLLLYNLFLLFSVREASYFYFTILLASLVLEEASYDGYFQVYIIPNLDFLIPYVQPVTFSLTIASLVLFSDAFLELKERLPKFHSIFMVIAAILGIVMVLTPFTSYQFIASLVVPIGVLSILSVFVVGLISWNRGFRPVRFFMLAGFGMLVSLLVVILVRLGLIPSTFFSENVYRLGFLWIAVCWSIALADRINLLKAQKEKAYDEVQASETRYRRLVETMNDGLGVVDSDGYFTYVNNRLAEMLGYSLDEIVGRSMTEFLDEENRQVLVTELAERRNGSGKFYELTWRRKDGGEVFTFISPVPLFSDAGQYIGAFAVITDITERVMASRLLEQRVDERTHELSALLAISRDISATRDLMSVIQQIMDRLKTIIDYRGFVILAEEDSTWKILAQDCLTIPAEGESIELSSNEVQAIIRDFSNGKPIRVGNFDPDGPNFDGFRVLVDSLSRDCASAPSGWLGVPLLEKGRPSGALVLGLTESGVSDDQVNIVVTFANQTAIAIENNQLYRQVRDTAVVEERNRLANDLHDSVTQVLFSASLLAEVLPQIWRRDPEQGLQKLEKLRRLTRGALAEMRTLLHELRPSAIINTPLSELLTQLTEAVASRSGISIQLFVEQIPALPEDVHINFYRIAQEALNNIIKHAQANRVIISLAMTRLSPHSAGKGGYEIKLVIRDDGVGFPQENAQFSRRGLGIMRERAKVIEADFSLDSKLGYGTQVTLIWCQQLENE